MAFRCARVGGQSHATQHFASTTPNLINTLGQNQYFRRGSDFNIILILVLPLGRRFLIFFFQLGGYVTFFPFIIFPTETGAKNKRPQARPRAKESVMIPTLLMNIPNPPTKQQPKRQFLFASGSGFCEFSFCFFFFLFYLFFYCGMGNGTGVAYIRMGIEVGGQALLGGGHQQIHRRRKKSGSAMP